MYRTYYYVITKKIDICISNIVWITITSKIYLEYFFLFFFFDVFFWQMKTYGTEKSENDTRRYSYKAVLFVDAQKYRDASVQGFVALTIGDVYTYTSPPYLFDSTQINFFPSSLFAWSEIIHLLLVFKRSVNIIRAV